MNSQLEQIVRKISERIKPKQIILFGSRAAGTNDEESDYDLAIIYEGDKSKRDVKLDIYRLFIPPGFSMDLVVLTPQEFQSQQNIANTLAREIAEKGVVVYG